MFSGSLLDVEFKSVVPLFDQNTRNAWSQLSTINCHLNNMVILFVETAVTLISLFFSFVQSKTYKSQSVGYQFNEKYYFVK